MRSDLNSSIISISTSDTKEYIINSLAQTRIIESVKRRFPVLLKIGLNSYVITEYTISNGSIELSAIDYTQKFDEQETVLTCDISDGNWVLSGITGGSEEYNTMVFDMYSYIKSYTAAYNITDRKEEYSGNLKVEFNVGSTGKEISGIVKDEFSTIAAAEFWDDGVTTVQADDSVLISSVKVTYTSGQPDIYNASKIHKIKVYTDIFADEWYYQYVMSVTEKGIMNGYEEDGIITFRPAWKMGQAPQYGYITRGEFVKTVLCAADIYGIDDIGNFDEVDGVWAKNYIEKANELGLLTNYVEYDSDNTEAFSEYQDTLLTRAEAAYILYKLFIKNSTAVTVPTLLFEYTENANTLRNVEWNSHPFKDWSDVESNTTYIEAIRQMFLNSVLDGSSESSGVYFYPNKTITRAEVSKIISKCLFNLDEDIEVIQATYKSIDGYDETYIDFGTEVIGVGNSNNGYWFNTNRSGYYFIAVKGNDGGDVNFNLYDEDDNLLKDDFTKLYIDELNENEIPSYITSSMTDGDYMNYRYYLEEGQDVFIRDISCTNNTFTIKVSAPQDGDIVFRPDEEGYFIYASNPEYVGESDLINLDGNTHLLMRLDDLGPGKYTFMAWHNYTSSSIKAYIDVLFNANEKTNINITYWC